MPLKETLCFLKGHCNGYLQKKTYQIKAYKNKQAGILYIIRISAFFVFL